MKTDISKEDLYTSVKTLVETDAPHLHFAQHKLFTLFSIAFQYFLFRSTKVPGFYILRIEDSQLADKLARKSKDPSTRKFLQSLLIPRKLKYGKSTFLLDFFHIGSWNITNEVPAGKIQGALIIKNTSSRPMTHMDEEDDIMANLPPNFFLTGLMSTAPKTITIAFDDVFPDLAKIEFPFITKDKEKTVSGVTISNGIDWDNID